MGEVIDLNSWRNENSPSSRPRGVKVGGRKVLEFGIVPHDGDGDSETPPVTSEGPYLNLYIDETAVNIAAQALFDLEMAIKVMPSGMEREIEIRRLTDEKDECMENLHRESGPKGVSKAIAEFKVMISDLNPPEAS